MDGNIVRTKPHQPWTWMSPGPWLTACAPVALSVSHVRILKLSVYLKMEIHFQLVIAEYTCTCFILNFTNNAGFAEYL